MKASKERERPKIMPIKSVEQAGVLDGTYKKIADELVNNGYPIGTKLQPLRILAKNYKVSYLTVQKAIKVLQMQGALTAKPGDGIYVTGRPKPLSGQVADFLENGKEDGLPAFRTNGRKNGFTKNHSLCVIMPYWVSERGSACIYSIIKGILGASDPYHWPVELIHNTGDEIYNESSKPDFVDKIEQREPDGIIWIQPILGHKMNIMRLIDRGHKVVVTGRPFKNVPVKCVHMDYYDMAEKATDFFLERGCKKIALFPGYFHGQIEDQYSVEIIRAFKEIMNKRGIPLPEDNICQSGFRPIHKRIIRPYLEEKPDIDGIVCFHEHILTELERLDKLGHFDKIGRKVPMVDVSGIFNFSDHQLGQIEHMNIEWPLENMGRAVIREFEKEWLENVPDKHIDLSVKLIK